MNFKYVNLFTAYSSRVTHSYLEWVLILHFKPHRELK